MSVSLTEEQRAAIAARGKTIVSASAGSGKTFVMIERLVSLLISGAELTEILAVTFTTKAAAQMRERLRRELIARISEGGGDAARLKTQLDLLPSADICTIHSFCARLVRTYFYIAGVDPLFRIVPSDDPESKELVARALDETFETVYREEEFSELLSIFVRHRSDKALRDIVIENYYNVRGIPDYETLLARAGEDRFGEVCEVVAEDFRRRAGDLAEEGERLAAGVCDKVRPVCERAAAAVKRFAEGELFELAAAAGGKLSVPSAPDKTKAEGRELADIEAYSAYGKKVRALCKELAAFSDRGTEYERYLGSLRCSEALAKLILRFDTILSRLKSEKSVLDYDDLERLAFVVLGDPDALGAVRGKYKYVFVDEYQDVNSAQERLVDLVGGGDVFLVGDIKQSIYGFRGSRSEYFARRMNGGAYSALSLSENFRSAGRVLEAVNRVFSYAMKREVCGYGYVPMRGGARFEGQAGEVKFHRVCAEKKPPAPPAEVYSVMRGRKKEADSNEVSECVVGIAEEELERGVRYEPGKGFVPVSAGDIAILVRKKSGDAERIVHALSERNIPVTSSSKVNVCDFFEVRLLIGWLSLLDNAEQDIPLAGAMLSAAGGFTEGDLAEIRARYPKAYAFRTACREFARRETSPLAFRLKTFFSELDVLRAQAQVLSARETADLLLARGLESEIAAKRDGRNRLRRLRHLVAGAKGSVHDFLRMLAASDYKVEYAESGGDDAVKVLTMHAGKGLEFPVVILANMDSPFHSSSGTVLFTERFLFATKYYDVAQKISFDTVLRRAQEIIGREEDLRGELNLFYVAATRAEYRLHIVCKGESKHAPRYADRFSDFIDFAACAEYFSEEPAELPPVPRTPMYYTPDESLKDSILAVYESGYPHAESVDLPVKSSATDLMRRAEREENERHFSGGGGTVEQGLAYHAFLEHAEFGRSAESELARMREEGVLSEDQLALLDAERLEKILAMPSIAALAGKKLRREQKFLARIPASEFGAAADDAIVFQGAIDLLAEDGDGFTILDYKYSSHDDERIRADYAVQISLYRKAVSRAMGVGEEKIRARIVNIMLCREIEM